MPFLWSAQRIARGVAWGARGRARSPERGGLKMTVGLPSFIGDDIPALLDAVRLIGPVSRCRERLAASTARGLTCRSWSRRSAWTSRAT